MGVSCEKMEEIRAKIQMAALDNKQYIRFDRENELKIFAFSVRIIYNSNVM